ncbi:TssN family type VI secretion system protein [Olleya sp. ITB9]|uniref:TssN family type VI secretion system protein n=1 Tax=Olleya sp. ITB9 TaxID=1715648 RepID=UPI0004870822|nr:TssN family type VI secretion system protein [Olleya sp. ITB9]
MGSLSSLLNGNAFKISILLFIVGSIIMMLFTKIRKTFSKQKKQSILYAIFILITFGLVGFISSSKILNDTAVNSFIGMQIVFLILGLLHLYILRKFFPALSEDKSDYFSEFLFTIAITLIGLFAFLNVVTNFREGINYTFLAASIPFIFPFMVYKLYEFSLLIPVPEYKNWFYPLEVDVKEPTKKELQNPLVISFEFKKNENLPDITNFRVKAPENMEFGKLFYFFINDYNERHPESQIDYLDQNTKEPNGWIFYKKPTWISSLRHINFSKTVLNNDIKEDYVIVCQRTNVN